MGESGKARAAAYVVAAILIAVAGVRYLDGRGGRSGADGHPPAVELDGHGRGNSHGGGGSRRRARPIFVHVAGAVRRPGLYRVPRGSRTAVAILRAGGLTPRADPALVNLAAPLQDGQQVVVARAGEAAPAAAGAAGGAPGTPGAPIRLSSATPEQLEELDGIGPTLAQRIIDYREKGGGFRSLDQLREVDGIGEKRFEALSEAVRP